MICIIQLIDNLKTAQLKKSSVKSGLKISKVPVYQGSQQTSEIPDGSDKWWPFPQFDSLEEDVRLVGSLGESIVASQLVLGAASPWLCR